MLRRRTLILTLLALTLVFGASARAQGDAWAAFEAASSAAARAHRARLREARDAEDPVAALAALRQARLEALLAEEQALEELEAAPAEARAAALRERRLQRLRLTLALDKRLAARALAAQLDDPLGWRILLTDARARGPEALRELVEDRLRALPELRPRAAGPTLVWLADPRHPLAFADLEAARAALEALGGRLELRLLLAEDAPLPALGEGAPAARRVSPELGARLGILASPVTLLFDIRGALRAVDAEPEEWAACLAER